MTDKRYLKKTGEELQQYLMGMRRATKIDGKKGRCPYKRNQKHKGKEW